MIPKVIHYCWFGDQPLSSEAQKCIDSWRKYLPGFEIKEWNNSNFDFSLCAYVQEAAANKKWAFVSDYARFWILYREGGVYFDTDVELISDYSSIVAHGPFMGCEKADNIPNLNYGVNPGLGIGAVPKMDFYRIMLDEYNKAHFMNPDGTLNHVNIVERTSNVLKKYGYLDNDSMQNILGMTIYPHDYFCPMDYSSGNIAITEVTKSIHWYKASWLDDRMLVRRKRNQFLRAHLPGRFGAMVSRLYMTTSYYLEWVSEGKLNLIYKKIKNRIINNGKINY